MGQLDWKFIQSFGDDTSSDDDLVTYVEFDGTGQYVAVGDKAGRICIFHGQKGQKQGPTEYKFYTEFQSHEPEFDCLKNLELEEKINMVKWCKPQNTGLFLLATNYKAIKYWKIHEKKIKHPSRSAIRDGAPLKQNLVIPQLSHYQTVTTATPKQVFSNAHNYYINSISINSDGETFISADDLRINLWNLEVPNESFNIVDKKPQNLEKLTEVITSATFHPTACNVLIFSTSRGIRLGDLRDSALCDHHAKLFEAEEDPTNKEFFSEIITSILDIKFSQDGRYILSRDYLTLKVWDVNMESRPVVTIPIHDYLKTYLVDLYENDCIFDKFECAMSPDASMLLSGSYNNNFVIHDMASATSTTIEAPKNSPRREPTSPNVNLMDFGKKALHVAWHPNADVVAIAGLNKLYIYEGVQGKNLL